MVFCYCLDMADRAEDHLKRMTIRYEGNVQGVGFRYSAIRMAAACQVTGYVQNDYDGSVLLVAEGSEKNLLSIAQQIRNSHLGRYIHGEDVNWSAATNEFKSFTIRYG